MLDTNEILSECGEVLVCGSHQAKFLVQDGKCVEGPCAGSHLVRIPVEADAQGRVIIGQFTRTAERTTH